MVTDRYVIYCHVQEVFDPLYIPFLIKFVYRSTIYPIHLYNLNHHCLNIFEVTDSGRDPWLDTIKQELIWKALNIISMKCYKNLLYHKGFQKAITRLKLCFNVRENRWRTPEIAWKRFCFLCKTKEPPKNLTMWIWKIKKKLFLLARKFKSSR